MKSIKFSNIVSFLGRNGLFKAIGLDVYVRRTMAYNNAKPQTLCITPTTSKGLAARCEIEVPIADIGKMVEAIGSELMGMDTKGSDYASGGAASPWDRALFHLFFYASDEDSARLIGAFPEKFLSK